MGMPRWVNNAIGAAAIVAVPLAVGGLRGFLSQDPFGYFDDRWAEPFGGKVGSVMRDVRAEVFEKGERKASFVAGQVDIRRDKQFLDLFGLRDGKVYENDVARASFSAERATFNAAEEMMMIFGGANVKSKEFDLSTPEAKLDIRNKRAVMSKGIEGTAFKGSVKAGKLELGFRTGTHRAENVEWRGKPPVQGISQSREVQFRADEVEFTSDPDVVVYRDAEAIDENALMRAKKVTYDSKADVVTLEGDAEYYGAEVIVSAPKVVVYRKQERALANGGVYFLVKPEGEKGIPIEQKQPAQPVLPPGLEQPENVDELRSSKNLRRFPVVVTANAVEYFYKKGGRKAIMTGEPKALQQLRAGSWREVTAPRAEYEEEQEILNLFSSGEGKDVRMKNSAGDDFVAFSVRIGTTSGKETMFGKGIEGVMKVRDDEVPRASGGGG
jgi:lipopolysaccharide export system protein LptA